MPAYFALIVPGGVAAFAAIVGFAALLLERRLPRNAVTTTSQDSAAYSRPKRMINFEED
jgi:nitrate reductase gamma subunit